MEAIKIIVSSRNLHQVLRSLTPISKPVQFHGTYIHGIAHATLNGVVIGSVRCGFQAFGLSPERAQALRDVVAALAEQPITLVWDGERMTITDFKI